VDASGRELTLTLSASNAAFRQAWVPVFAAQMQACGLRIEVSLLNAAQFFGSEGPLARREFDLAAYPGVIQPYPDASAFACAAIPAAENGFSGANFAGWCNPAADAAAASIAQTLAADSLHADYQTLQIEASRNLPILPLFRRPEISAAAAGVQGFDPQPGQVYTWNTAAWHAPGRDTLIIGERSEPAGLHPLDSAWVNQTVQALIAGLDVAQQSFGYQPVTSPACPPWKTAAQCAIPAGD
jgi:peptide/nickel transport system substrate-binding protein